MERLHCLFSNSGCTHTCSVVQLQLTHTLLLFFNNMPFQCSMMLIHLASLCLTKWGCGPTCLTGTMAAKAHFKHKPSECCTIENFCHVASVDCPLLIELFPWVEACKMACRVAAHTFVCCHQRKTATTRQETGKPHGSSVRSPWQQVRMLSMGKGRLDSVVLFTWIFEFLFGNQMLK